MSYPYRRECGCEVSVKDLGMPFAYRLDCETPVHYETIHIEPCDEHDDHPHGAFRKEADA